jgi:hypothetical protein
MVVFALVVYAAGSAHAQTIQTLLANGSTALSQGKPVNTVTLNANALWTAGSDNETGNATLTAGADGSLNLQLQLGQGARTETQTSFSSGQSCAWSGTDGVVHAMATHNCMGSVAWFLPFVSLFGNQQPSAIVTTLQPTSSGSATQLWDIRQQRTPPAAFSGASTALLSHLSVVDIYLDPVSYLPSALAFNIHPDQNGASDIPVQVVFSNYTIVNGVALPFRIQRYINGSLNLDLTVTQASTN